MAKIFLFLNKINNVPPIARSPLTESTGYVLVISEVTTFPGENDDKIFSEYVNHSLRLLPRDILCLRLSSVINKNYTREKSFF